MPEYLSAFRMVAGNLRNFSDMFNAAKPLFEELNEVLNESPENREKNTVYNEE